MRKSCAFRLTAFAVVAALWVGACSSDEAADDPTGDTAATDTTADAADDAVFGPDGDDTDGEGADSATSTTNPFDTDEPAPVVVEANPTDTLPDDVIIATDDGLIPTTTVEVPPTTATTEPTTPASPPPSVEIPDPSEVGRIVSLSPTHTETVAALGALSLLVGVDELSDHPDGVQDLHIDGVSADTADLTAIVALEPDLVLVGEDFSDIEGALADAGIATVVGPPATSLDEVYRQILDIASAIGRDDEGTQLVDDLQQRVDAIVQDVAEVGLDSPTFFHEFNPDLATPTEPGLLADLYGQLGLTNIAAPNGQPTGRLTSDEVIAANPTVIVLADAECCGVTAERVASRPGWAELSAVQNGTIVAIPDALAQRWGPRTVDLIELVGGALLVSQ